MDITYFDNNPSEIEFINDLNGISLSILREDRLHPEISGNKFRKLKYNLKAYFDGDFESLLTFGGAYSNHIAATAAAGRDFNIPAIGIIRGEELSGKISENPTLTFARENGMKLYFISRREYRKKEESEKVKELISKNPGVFILPEGGTNENAVRGCEEILGEHTKDFDFICCPVGTGGTLAGLIRSANENQKVLGFPALKTSDFLYEEIQNYTPKKNYELLQDYHFGGYGKINKELITFVNYFKTTYKVPLDPVYTGKMMFGLFDLIKNGNFRPGNKILAIHTGGIQGIDGMNKKLEKKGEIKIL